MIRSSRTPDAVPTRPAVLLWSIAVLLVAAVAAVCDGTFLAQARDSSADDLQQLVGGLGLGPSLDVSRCWASFDPRLEGVCGEQLWPLPDAGFVCPEHGGRVVSYPELPVGR